MTLVQHSAYSAPRTFASQNFLQTIAGSAVLSVAVLVAPAVAPAFMTCVSLGFTLLLCEWSSLTYLSAG